ncbi:gliding motility-associated C-terminal domain-containing protein [Mucilaginibacter boryungensis]|uniref:Gliding motility-associated C-terminal domain-containing protein n=1 Tax=Mucilaginibacter boryungensis TaxID=768480 RepID=A0ABR9XIK1_9SPHI|nr:gliding motility-associated C-terminal domain-containing protein [Mucilaginibacter boryungensis]MBE9667199.1 gliding motility-associated C-terminal domain-containing protein [Mucilaginibacter boryungensis]
MAQIQPLPLLDTCNHQFEYTIIGILPIAATIGVEDTTIASISGKLLIIHKRGKTFVTIKFPGDRYETVYENGQYLPPIHTIIEITRKYELTIGPPPQPAIAIAGSANSDCEGDLYMFTSQVTGKVKGMTAYQWKVNGVNSGNDSLMNIRTLKAKDIVTCTVTNAGSCETYADTDTLIVPDLKPSITPALTIVASETPVCTNKPVSFTATLGNQTGALTYQWRVNNSITGTNSPVFTSSILRDGDEITCTAGNIGHCVLPVTSEPYIVKTATPPTVKFDKNIVINHGGSTQLIPTTTGNIAAYKWGPATGLSSTTEANPIASPATTTTYSLVVTNTDGCEAQASITVAVGVSIPTVFTPNGDGINDTWNIPALVSYPNCNVSVYNRFGSLVFQSKGYDKAWDSTYNGKMLPQGTYYYVINTNNSSTPLTGNVTIIR